MDDEEFVKPLDPVPKKKHKGIKVTGMTVALLAALAVTSYAGISSIIIPIIFSRVPASTGSTAPEKQLMRQSRALPSRWEITASR